MIVSIASISITIDVIKMVTQVVTKIQKEMAEKKLTSDFETVAILSSTSAACQKIIIVIVLLTFIATFVDVVFMIITNVFPQVVGLVVAA